jgi:hypothetical protein
MEESLLPRFQKRLGHDHTEINRRNEERDKNEPEALAKMLDSIVYPEEAKVRVINVINLNLII